MCSRRETSTDHCTEDCVLDQEAADLLKKGLHVRVHSLPFERGVINSAFYLNNYSKKIKCRSREQNTINAMELTSDIYSECSY